MTALEVGKEGGKASGCGDRKEGRLIGGSREQIEQGGEEDASGLLFGGEAEKLGIERDKLLFLFKTLTY